MLNSYMTPEQWKIFKMTHDERADEKPSVWTATGLQTARNELIEHGYIYIQAPENEFGYDKIITLDRHLRSSGIGFHRTRMADIVKYELVSVKKGRLAG